MEGIIPVVIGLVMCVAIIWAFCNIFGKAGFSKWMGLLMIVPLVNFIMILYLGFAEWPVHRRS
jgi:hypothetical protein